MTLWPFLRGERGQAIVIVGASLTVLLGALALAVDWGHGFAVRRALQNGADAAALGVGKTLATSTVVIDGELRFYPSDRQMWDRADALVTANAGLASSVTLTLEYGDEALNWTESEGASSNERIPDDTVYVRVRTSSTYPSLVAAVVGVAQVDAAASARVRLSGAETPLGPVLPLLRHFNADVFSTTCPGACADPSDADPMTLWQNPGWETFRQFEGAVDLSRYSHNAADGNNELTTAQLLEDWDRSGSAAAGTPLKDDHSDDRCDNGFWDTAGNEEDDRQNERCSVPNWFYYGYGGDVSVTTSYTGVALPREAPTTFAAASQTWCAITDADWQATYGFRPDPRAACDRGDWIETVENDVDRDMSDALLERIADEGAEGILSGNTVQGGPNNNDPFGDAITVLVLLWDCGEEYDKNAAAGSRWGLILPSSGPADCTDLPSSGPGERTPGRVHMLTVAPFTIYEGLVHQSAIEGYWGGLFVDPPADAPRPLWVFANSAYLVPDE